MDPGCADDADPGSFTSWWESVLAGHEGVARAAVATCSERVVGAVAVRFLGTVGRDSLVVRERELVGPWVDPVASKQMGIAGDEVCSTHFSPLWRARMGDADEIRGRLLDYALPGLSSAQTWQLPADRATIEFLRSEGFTLDGMERIDRPTGLSQVRLVR